MNTTSFADTFPVLIRVCRELYGHFSIIASVLVFAGLLGTAVNGSFGDLNRTVRGLVTAALVVVMIGIFPRVVDLLQDIGHSLATGVGADPEKAHEKFAELIGTATSGDPGGEVGFWDILLNSDHGGLGEAILYAIVFLMAKISHAIMWIAYLIQQILVLLGISLAPLFVAMLTLEATRGIAGRYFLSLIAVISWPIGWAVASVITEGLLSLAAGHGIYRTGYNNIMVSGTQMLFFTIVLSIWMLASAIAVPIAVNKLLVHGIQIGSSLLAGAGNAASQAFSFGVGAGVTTSLSGAGKGMTGAAAAAGAAGGLVSGATGGGGVLIPAMIGTAAVMASSKNPEKEADEMANKLRKSKS